MTIRVEVTNKDDERRVDIQQLELSTDGTPPKASERVILEPGESRSFYIHLLRELRVAEMHPDG